VKPLVVHENSLSVAWVKLLSGLLDTGGLELGPTLVVVDGFSDGKPKEDARIPHILDGALRRRGLSTINTVANTIFPYSLWNKVGTREELYRRYNKILPAIKKCPPNKYGIYFQRLIDYKSNGKTNQIEYVISTYLEGNHRRSALQLALFDPERDSTNQRTRGFPCLQQIAVAAVNNQLTITGFYPMQYHFEKSYGNYLGLFRLGEFIAHALECTLVQMTCVSNVLSLGNHRKSEMDILLDELAEAAPGVVDTCRN
jgi:hypothetical protein